MSEVSLYPAVKRFLEAAGFDVKGEVKGCDIVAVRLDETLTIVYRGGLHWLDTQARDPAVDRVVFGLGQPSRGMGRFSHGGYRSAASPE